MKRLCVFLVLCACILIYGNGLPSGVYPLSAFGPVENSVNAQATLAKAVKELKNGGIIWLGKEVAPDYVPSSVMQETPGLSGVTIVDMRQGKLQFILPSLGMRNPESPWGYSAFLLDRTINQDAVNINGLNAAMRISDRVIRGTGSYFQPVKRYEKTDDPETMKIYVPTVKGLYPGLELYVQMGRETTTYGEVNFTAQIQARVEKLGFDDATKEFYVIMRKNNPRQPWAKILSMINKSSTCSLLIREVTHADQENAGTLTIDKYAYGQGDNFGVGMTYLYMGNVMSTRGDENGNTFTANIWHILNSFLGKVEKYDSRTNELHFDAHAINSNTLGTSRPIINLNPQKWLTEGKIAVESRFFEDGSIDPKGYVRGIGANWTPQVVGRYLAVDMPEEYAGNPPQGFWKGILKGRKVRRWWYITHYEKVNGEDRLWVERVRHLVYDRAVPTLINEQNYRRELPYIIAPGAMAADVSRGVPEMNQHHHKEDSVKPGPSRIIVLAPSGDGENAFAPGDPIEQAVGSDPSHPSGYRVRHREAMPSNNGKGCSFSAINNGAYPVGAALGVYGAFDKMQIPHHSKFFNIIDVSASCDYGIRFRNTVKNAVLYMEKPEHRIAWRTGTGEVALSADNGALSLNNNGISKTKSISATDRSGHNLRGINIQVPNGKKHLAVQFAQPEPDAEYSLTVQPNWLCRWAVTEKNARGFTVVFDENASTQSAIDWQLIR